MKLSKGILAIPLCGLLISCALQHKANSSQSENANQSNKQSADSLVEKFGEAQLLNQLKREQAIEKPFAWESWDGKQEGGTVIGIDQKGKLKRVEFTRTENGYTVKASDYAHKLNTPIEQSGDLILSEYLPDTEFPFKSYVISAGDCKVHFVLLWQAHNRSFKEHALYLDSINLRIIAQQGGQVVSNEPKELLFLSVDKTLVEDVNKDGKPDFLVIGSDMFVRIWTVGSDCAAKPLLFKEDETVLQYVGDKGLFLTRNKASGGYDIHIEHFENVTDKGRFYLEITETVYQWDPKESVYKIKNTRTRLEPTDDK